MERWFLTTVLVTLMLSGALGQCSWSGRHHRFGRNCEFQCHCKKTDERCNTQSGNCDSGCEPGWMGPGCQFGNIAEGSIVEANFATQGPQQDSTDGDQTTCTQQTNPAENPFVRVLLDETVIVTQVSVTFRNYTAVAGFSVYAGTSTLINAATLCQTETENEADGNRVTVVCSRPMAARYVSIQLFGQKKYLEICEVDIPAGRNIAYRKPAFASSVEAGRIPDYALNGDETDNYGSTLSDDPWWYVDLETIFKIHTLRIINRDDLRTHLAGFHVRLSNSSDFANSELIYVDNSSSSSIQIKIAVPIYRQARYVRIYLTGPNRRLHMREVYVLGGCMDNECGFNCSNLCYCQDKLKSIENEIYGTCMGNCERNWRNVNGYCNTSICSDNRFGYECKFECHCDGLCDPWTGICLRDPKICQKHYFGLQCQGYNTIQESKFAVQGSAATYYSANNTVDGNTSTCAPVLSGQGASWVVALGAAKPVNKLIVYVNDSTTNYGFEVTSENVNSFFQCETSRQGSDGPFLANCKNVAATHVRLRTRSSMQICEVVVLECEAGTFGELCQDVCLCADGKACNISTGTCPDGDCESGYYGPKCDRECVPGTYGNNCTSKCGRCAGGAVCDIFTGQCPSRCQAGWQGGRCDSECRNGTYGQDCLLDCGFCLDKEPCNKLTGMCTIGCNAGYFTDKCFRECDAGSYGYNCNETCGQCTGGQICDRIDGTCRNGCELGKQPPLCRADCTHGLYGNDCRLPCGDCRYNITCNPVTGVCDDGCDPGVYVSERDPMCKQECQDGNFGYNCSQKCIEDVCQGGDVCNKTNGGCLRGCLKPGFQPPLCLTVCCDGTFGQGCTSMCGMCLGRRACNKTTGACPNGCEEGFVGANCEISEWATKLNVASIVMLVFGILLAICGVVAIAVAYWVYRRRGKPFLRRKNKYDKEGKPPRNASLVSRVYENNISMESDLTDRDLKRSNSNSSNYMLPDIRPKGTVTVDELWEYVQENMKSKTTLVQQFKELAAGLTHPCEAAKKAQNLRKNRYKEIFPYDHSRVTLDINAGDTGNDYINAGYISGYNRPHMYIASQGPTEELIPDFWRMVWQKKCRKIVMLTRLLENNKVKCAQYWPDEGCQQYGPVSVELKEVESFADFDIRTFIISSEVVTDTREVKQFHYSSWPDRHVPEYASSVVHFWNKVRATDCKDNVPIVVHCSAGIGRTGTYIALDYLVDQANIEGYVNILQCVQNLRHQRVNMVQNQEQYNFLHEALVETLLCPSAVIPCEQFSNTYMTLMEIDAKSQKSKLHLEYEKLQHVTKFHESMKSNFYDSPDYKVSRNTVNVEKNRNRLIVPNDMHRPWLTTRVTSRNDYINAVYLPSHREDKMFILTQNPFPDTIVDLWRMVYENRVTTIVNMDQITLPSEIYWPTEGETLTFIPFQLHHVTEVDHTTFIERTMKFLNAEQPREKARIIKQFECKFWTNENKIPTGSEDSILAIHEHVLKWQQINGNQPIVVHCLNGATKSGLYCVVTATIERLKQERDVALQQTIKQMRIRRHQIIPTYEQYKFCHDIVSEFLNGFDTYSNFFI